MTARVIGIMGAVAATTLFAIAASSSGDVPKPPAADPAFNAAEAAQLDDRLDQLAQTNEQISNRLDQVMRELQIVKTRASIKRDHDD